MQPIFGTVILSEYTHMHESFFSVGQKLAGSSLQSVWR